MRDLEFECGTESKGVFNQVRVWPHCPLLLSNSPTTQQASRTLKVTRSLAVTICGGCSRFWFSREEERRKQNSCPDPEGRGGEGRTNGLQAVWMGTMVQNKDWGVDSKLVYCVQPGLQPSVLLGTYIHLCVFSIWVWCLGPGVGRSRESF